MLAIKNNLMAANAARQLGINYDALATSVERLSSGLRINSAKDDAAGLAVRELMRADIAVINQGSRNAMDGISMLQTMEGAMQTINDALVRMNQLAEQATTGSYSSAQRVIMNAEFAEMADEINRIATGTRFNDIKMLDNTTEVNIQFGSATDVVTIAGADMTKSGLEIETGTGLWSATTSMDNSGDGEGAYDTTAETALTVGATNDLVININFTDSVGGKDQETITVTFAKDDVYTLEDIVTAINEESNEPNDLYDENGRFLGYSAASIVTTDESKFRLKISARDTDIDEMDIVIVATAPATIGGIFGTSVTEDTIMEDEIFQYWNADAGVAGEWVDDTEGTRDEGINILDPDAANAAMTSVMAAINAKDTARAAFGYKMNRLESTIAVLNIQSENLLSAESRISDVDVATEMAALTRYQVLSQAGVSMLAQANMMPQMALTLLR